MRFVRLLSIGNWLVYLGCLVFARATWAQTPDWVLATTGPHTTSTSISSTNAVATDDAGNVYVTGSFQGQLMFGSIVLTSDNANINTNTSDLFVAKYATSTNTWVWAQRGGGTFDDGGSGIALSGTSVYIIGTITNTANNARAVTMGGTNPTNSPVQVNGTSSVSSKDLLVAKYTDNGPSATLNWTQVGGGKHLDYGSAIAVSGSSVYVAGSVTNNAVNSQAVVFGGSGTVPGTKPQYGASSLLSSDILVAKYTDNGSSATLNWTQVGGGDDEDMGFGIAVNGPGVYVVGSFINNLANANHVVVGGTGTTVGTVPQYGASSTLYHDMVLLKYLDAGASASVVWTQAAGGTGHDEGRAVAVSNNQVYVTGYLTNSQANTNAVVFGGAGTTAGTVPQYGASSTSSQDILVAKYLDNGASASVAWTQVAGGTGIDWGQGIAVGLGRVFVTGLLTNNLANASNVVFGGAGTTVGSLGQPGANVYNNYDLVVAGYLDNGPAAAVAWTRVGGGQASDWGQGIALGDFGVCVVGQTTVPATFGNLTVSGAPADGNFLGILTTSLLAVHPASTGPSWQLYPNPTTGAITLLGLAPGTVVQVLDAAGRLVLTAPADGTARLVLPGDLAPGVYVVRAGPQARRLTVQ